MPQTLSVVICTRNRPYFVKQLLHQLQHQTRLPDQLIVVEDITQGKFFSGPFLKKMFPTVSVVYQAVSRVYIGRLRNIGLTKNTSDSIVFIDDDVRIPTTLLEKFSILHKLMPQALGFCGKIIPATPDIFSLFSAYLFNREYSVVEKMIPTPFYGFSCLSLNGKIIKREKIMFPEDIDSGEDILFLLQYTQKGYLLWYVPLLKVVHDFLRGGGLVSFFRRSYRYGKDLTRLHLREPLYFKEVVDSLPKKRWYWYIFPLYFIFKPLSQSLAFNSLYQMELPLLLPSYFHHLMYLLAISFSQEGRALLKQRFMLHFGLV